jgi:hypothetical protein
VEFALEFAITEPLERPEIGFSICSLTGTELVGVTTSQETPLERLAPGRYAMRVAVSDLCLNPGTYSLGVGIAAKERSVDNILEAAQIEIIPSEQSIRKELHKVWAVLTPRTDFQLSQL